MRSTVDEETIARFEEALAAKVVWDERNHYWCEFSTDGQALRKVMEEAGMSPSDARRLPRAEMTVYPDTNSIRVRVGSSRSARYLDIPSASLN